MSAPAPRIFVSHSHFDNEACRRLIAFLQRRFPNDGIFFDEKDLHGGDDWFRNIQHQVIAAPIFIVVLTRHSVVAEWVAEETNLALAKAVKDKTRKVIPVMMDPLPTMAEVERLAPILTVRQILDLSAPPPGAAWDDLARVIQGAPSPQPVVTADPSRQQELEAARAMANEVAEAVTARNWLLAAHLGRGAVTLPGNERDATLWGYIALAQFHEGDAAAALQSVETALALNGSRPDLWQLKAQILLKNGQPDLALSAWDQAFYKTGAPAARLEILAEQFAAVLQVGRFADADRYARLALQIAPNDPAWQQRQRDAQAVQHLTPLQARYDAAMQAKNWSTAIAACDEALRVVPQDTAWQQRQRDAQAARHQEAQAKRDAAERAYQEKLAQVAPLLTSRLQSLRFAMQRVNDLPVILPPMCSVSAGPFTMGGDKDAYNGGKTGVPQVHLTLGAFEIGMYPLTVAEWACGVAAGVVPAPRNAFGLNWQRMCQQRPDHPVVNMLWMEVMAYCVWLAQVTGQAWRLPTEAEWERAARGTDGRVYPWGNQWDKARANTSDRGPGTTTPVGFYADKGDASPCGAHDMAGNVWEWTSSIWHDGLPYNQMNSENNSDKTSYRVLRGGLWHVGSQDARAAARDRVGPSNRSDYVGVRLALSRAPGS
jgi:formylglycine-generating enzyme required for sulfatase activity